LVIKSFFLALAQVFLLLAKYISVLTNSHLELRQTPVIQFNLKYCITCVIHFTEVIFMHKVATVNARIEPKLKTRAESILRKIGLTSAEAVRLFYRQVCLNNGLPFEVKIPHKKTIQAMHNADHRKTHKAKNVDELFKDIG
jgi:DNA-damage-inducible protein J